ncbi:hypothetical protein EGR_06069 [Echinococcus granulosus]|uniref:Uncharacterized protein n=1 Tax=Echinococcus granulosus TaxID=6210 RepID=W6ULQ2_ECHGR|nr:hypothetical protein EGR_06069 [Echinococcus granulosus]EUB59077.1 hypothetical protein EGR_06069 [Echinococcus granulosus]
MAMFQDIFEYVERFLYKFNFAYTNAQQYNFYLFWKCFIKWVAILIKNTCSLIYNIFKYFGERPKLIQLQILDMYCNGLISQICLIVFQGNDDVILIDFTLDLAYQFLSPSDETNNRFSKKFSFEITAFVR